MGLFDGHRTAIVSPEQALAGRRDEMTVPERHFVLGTPLAPPFPDGSEQAVLAMGCFWGAERRLWQQTGVHTTAAGYSGGYTPNPTYEEVCSGRTGHAECVLVVFDPSVLRYEEVIASFFEGHDPTQGMRQGNDRGTQYRSAVYATSESQLVVAKAAAQRYQQVLTAAGFGAITTEITREGAFYYAEEYHQQYLAKNPGGYCGIGGTGVSCPVGIAGAAGGAGG